MNRELAEIIKLYAIGSDKALNDYLLGKSKNNLMATLIDLITMYINDKNSSTLREFLTVSIAGYSHREGKIGYNGYKQSVYGTPIKCEAKPKNVRSGGKRKLNGGGNFTDYTHERLKRDKKENLHMLVSGFVDGKLIYIIEFPFGCSTFTDRLNQQLQKRFPHGDISGQFLRSANFDYRYYINCKGMKVLFVLPKSELTEHKQYIVRVFYKFLLEVAPDDK